MFTKRVRRGCTFTHAAAGPVHGLSPKHSFDDSNNAEDQTRHDETGRAGKSSSGRLCTSGGRVDELVFYVARGLPMTASSCLGVDLNLSIKADPSVLQHPPPFLAIPAIA